MITKLRRFGTWPIWTGFLIAGLMVIVLLGAVPVTSQAPQAIEALQISKSVNVPSVVPGQAPAPLYTVTFTNPATTTIVLDNIVDILPSGFDFLGMHASSDWPYEPDDAEEPDIVWQGPITVPATGTLSLVYAVDVPETVAPSATPYVNTVVAWAGGDLVGPTSAKLLVGEADLEMEKWVSSDRVLNGEIVTYTIALTNSGHLTSTVAMITDSLDSELAFSAIAADSDVITPPQEMTNTLVWTSPLKVPPLSSVLLRYEIETTDESGWFYPCNRVDLLADTGSLGPAETCITVGPEKGYVYLPLIPHNFDAPYLTISKSVTPTLVTAGSEETIVYTVDIVNDGDGLAVVDTIFDSLPAGFTFQSMELGSDVTSDPDATTDTITWTGPFAIPGNSSMKVIYRVAPSDVPGEYVNYADLTSSNAEIFGGPASATVIVEASVLLEDDFEDGIGRWTKFLNYWRLTEEQWYYGQSDGYGGSGAVTHDCTLGKDDPLRGAEDGLLMYLGEDSENWTNYRVETKLLLRGGIDENDQGEPIYILEGGYPVGLWVRGQLLELEPDKGAGNITGYYVVIGGRPDKDMFVRLAQLQTTTDCWDQACNNPHNLYDFNNPHTLLQNRMDFSFERYQWYTLVVEVKDDWIRVWVNDTLALEYQDTKEPFMTGTVGFKTYKSWTVTFDDIIVTPLDD